jgi:cell division protein FtsI/penicillin-binding protein 2
MLANGSVSTRRTHRPNRKNKNQPKFRPIILKEDVNASDNRIRECAPIRFQDEISIEYQPRRRYLENELAAHAIGYLGEVTRTT